MFRSVHLAPLATIGLIVGLLAFVGLPRADVGTQQRLGRITAAEIQILCAQPGVEILEIEDNGVLITIVCDELPYDPEYPGEDD